MMGYDPSKCEYHREFTRRWREANRDKQRAYGREYRKRRFARDPKGAWIHDAWKRASIRARQRGWAFEKHDIPIPDVCPVLGTSLDYGTGNKKPGMDLSSPSLDRRDWTKGYVPGNVRIISQRANLILGDASVEELRRALAFRLQDG